MFNQTAFALADDEVAVAFADGGGMCGRDGGMSSAGGGGGCDKPSPNPADGCKYVGVAVGVAGKVPGFKAVAPTLGLAADTCVNGVNQVNKGIGRTETEVNKATGSSTAKSSTGTTASGSYVPVTTSYYEADGNFVPCAWGSGSR